MNIFKNPVDVPSVWKRPDSFVRVEAWGLNPYYSLI